MTATRRSNDPAAPLHTAFSLMEMVMVLAIMAVLSAIAVPRYSNTVERARADAVARRLVADLAYAQRAAKTTNQPQTVKLVWPSYYELVDLPGLNDPNAKYVVMLDEEPYGASGFSFQLGGDNNLVFDIYGMPDSGGWITINVGSQYRTVTIDADSGRAEITG